MSQTIKPVRIQRKRVKGYNMQAASRAINGLEAVSICRPGRWGNPFTVLFIGSAANAVRMYRDWLCWPQDYPNHPKPPSIAEIREKLRGRNLACFCKDGEVCHGDVLLEIANSTDTKAER